MGYQFTRQNFLNKNGEHFKINSLAISRRAIKTINQVNFVYVWRRKIHYIKQTHLIQEYAESNLQAMDFDLMNGILKINYLKYFLSFNHLQSHIPTKVFKKLGDIEFLLKCDFSIQSYLFFISRFSCTGSFFIITISLHTTLIWNNRYVSGKSVCNKEWLNEDIWSPIHLDDME